MTSLSPFQFNPRRALRLAMPTFAIVVAAAWSGVFSSAAMPSGRDSAHARQQREESAADPIPKLPEDPAANVAWEYEPYRVEVWLIDDGAQVFRELENRIQKRVQRDARLDEFNGWRVRCARAAGHWRVPLESAWDADLDRLAKPLSEDAALARIDKLIVVRLSKSRDGFGVQARELDMATRQWSTPLSLSAAEVDLIPAQTFAAVRRSFMPLTRIERVANETAYVRTRASALSRRLQNDESGTPIEVPNLDSPIWVRDNDILLPVLRRDAREDRSFVADPIDWTFLTIEERQGSTLKCLTHTAHLAPLAGRSGALIKKYALVVRPDPKPTKLLITAQDSKTLAPISGLEVYVCRPEEVKDKNYHLLGKTDWKGTISIPPADDGSIRYLILKNGQLAVKRPVLPGLAPTLTTSVPSDRARIFAEGVIYGLRGEIIDWAALRATTQSRIEIALEKKEFDKASRIYNDEFLKLRSIRQLTLRLSEVKDRLLSRRDADARQRARIDAMFTSLEQSIGDIERARKKREQDSKETDLATRVLNKISDATTPEADSESPPEEPTESVPENRDPPEPSADTQTSDRD